LAGLLVAVKAPVVGGGADEEHPVGLVQAIEHPARPAFGRGAVDVAVEDGGDAVLPQPLGEGEDVLAVGVAIVAVAQEDPRWCGHGWRSVSSFCARKGV
jgi:hypothetical protein